MNQIAAGPPFAAGLFAQVLPVTVHVIIVRECPRSSLIWMTDSDEVLVSLRSSINWNYGGPSA